MKTIKILGKGCTKCNQLHDAAEQAANQLGVEYQIEKITDINKFPDYGVMMTPALVIDGEVKSTGKVLSVDKIKEYIGG